MSGPPPLPTKLKVLRGTFRASRGVTGEAMPDEGEPDMPPHLSAEAKAEWQRVCPILAALGLLNRLDRGVLAQYCEAWSDWVDACRMCASKDGIDRKVITTKLGNYQENPYFSIKKRSAELMHKFACELGIGAASRSRISTGGSGSGGAGSTSSWGAFGT